MNNFTCNISSTITFLSCGFAVSSTFLFCKLSILFHSLTSTRQTAFVFLPVPHTHIQIRDIGYLFTYCVCVDTTIYHGYYEYSY